ncbi:50S ribosomal protein L16 [Candidatus Woesearchaeota archaeon]|nr:50S ribosomal protein L16 [Candidatus Woesearchaeota archaeon]
MAGLRKGCCYRRLERPYTRKSKYKSKSYIKAFPNHKISRFEMGERNRSYEYKVKLVSKGTLQIRQNSIESARMIVNRALQDNLGTNYYLKINVYPHHALRENKMLGGAHADRLQTGMAHSFGKVVNTAAQMKKGKELMTAWVFRSGLDQAKQALKSAAPRLSGQFGIEIEPVSV